MPRVKTPRMNMPRVNMPRMNMLGRAEMSPEQIAVFDAIAAGPRGEVPILFQPWLRNPKLADLAQRLGALCRYGTSLAPRLSELAILTTARHWSAQYEWRTHVGPARAAGLTEPIIEAIAAHQPPPFAREDEAAVHGFAHALLKTGGVDDAVFARASAALGEQGVVELTCILGYYTMAAFTLNAFALDAFALDESAPPLEN